MGRGALGRRAALLLPLAAGGCSVLDSIFGSNKAKLPGKRESVNVAARGLAVSENDTTPVVVPAPADRAEWAQPGGGATHSGGSIAVGGFNRAWRSSIGEGGGYRDKITAQPIVFDGRVGTMDSDGMVSVFDAAGGGRLWRTETQARKDRSTNVGGGISYAGGVVYAATGRGELLGLDAGSGAIKWRKPLGAPARSGPTVADGRLFVLTLDDKVQGFSASDGERQWTYQANTVATTLFGQAAPAVSDGIAVCGFGSGDLVALRAESGTLAWSDSLAAARGRNALADLSGIRALPVIDQGRVYAIGAGGLMVELDLRSGRRLWEREVAGLQTPWLAGDWLFVLTQEQVLAAIGRRDGRVRWLRELPRYDDPDKRRDPLYWEGPVLAGGKLILAGSNSTAVSVNPADGNLIGQIDIRDSVSVAPIAAMGTLFLVTDDGSIQAYR